jgi:hypothetical protein
MALRNEHGKLRPQPPRLKDLPPRLTAGEPGRGRDAHGRFVAGNAAATARGLKAQLKRALGQGATDEAAQQVYADALRLYRATLRALPSDDPRVQETVSRYARAASLSAHLAEQAMVAGLTTPAGQKLLELSMKLDARAERNAVTAADMAERLKGNAADPVAEAMRQAQAAFQRRLAEENK